MADLVKTKDDPMDQFWDQIKSVPAGMLGVAGSGQHLQPMAPHVDKENKIIWFYAKKKSAIVTAVGLGGRGHFVVVGKDHDYHTCMAGSLKQTYDRAKVDEFWNPVVAAWYEEGPEDPDLIMLEFVLTDAAVWAGSSSSLVVGWEIAKANLTDEKPDLGIRTHLNF